MPRRTSNPKKTPYIPDTLPLDNLDWRRLAPHTSKAMRSLALYDGTLGGAVNADILMAPLAGQESIFSTRIEGIHASAKEVLQYEAGKEYGGNKRKDIREVIKYNKALSEGEKVLHERKINLHFIRHLHSLLMGEAGEAHGGETTPGAFRSGQNWIGREGDSMQQAQFVPPEPMVMLSALKNLEEYIAADDYDPLVQLSIVHAQFEIIHPFNDGNGRLGRILVPLLLVKKGILKRPIFYISEALQQMDAAYRARLQAVSAEGDWHGWIEFFLQAIQVQAQLNIKKIGRMHRLYEEMKRRFVDISRSKYSVAALDVFFKKPVINSRDFLAMSGIPRRTAYHLLQSLEEEGVLRVAMRDTGNRPAIYVFPALLNIARRNVK